MAVGDITSSRNTIVLRVLDAVTSANGAPTSSTVGCKLPSLSKPNAPHETASIRVYSTAGSGTMTCAYVRLWGRWEGETRWFPLGTGSDADKGKLNQNTPGTVTAFGETGDDVIRHVEPFLYAGHCDYLYAEVGTLGGTGTAIQVDLVLPRGR